MPSDRAAPAPPTNVQPGDLVGGKYRIERLIAVGGMGVVLAARNEDLDQPVALKILRNEALTNEEAVTRFLREARTAARLQGEHVARVFDVGTMEGGVPYMVMEYLSGLDLQQIIGSRGPLPVRDAVDYVMQALEAVAEAHAAGVVHRDLKPSNLFLATRPDGTQHIKVLDFGISKGQGLDAPAGPGLTSTKQVMGSPGYMSPEQMISPRKVDGRTDVWSMGVLLYALLTGEQPFQGETVAAVMASILHSPVPRVRDKRSDAPGGLERVIERCLERELPARFQNVASLARSLAPYGSSWAKLSASRVESALGSSPTGQTLLRLGADDTDSLSGAAWARTALRDGSRRKLLAGAAATIAGALALGFWLLAGSREAPPSATAEPLPEAPAAPAAPPPAPEPPPEPPPAAPAPAPSVAPSVTPTAAAAAPSAPARPPPPGTAPTASPAKTAPTPPPGGPKPPAGGPTKPPSKPPSEADLLKERQ